MNGNNPKVLHENNSYKFEGNQNKFKSRTFLFGKQTLVTTLKQLSQFTDRSEIC